MTRARTVITSLKLYNSLLSTQISATRSISSQVIHFSPLSSYFLSNQSPFPFNANQNLYFSSTPNSVLQLLSANDWSAELESELETSNPALTHEAVIYVLKKLDKNPEKAFNFFNWLCDREGFRPSSSLYSLMLRILVDKDSMKKFWITLTKMKELGLYIDEETYITILGMFKREKMASDSVALKYFYERMIKENAVDDVVKKVVSLFLEAEWGDEVENALGSMKIVLTDNFVTRTLKELRNYPLKALNFFHWVGRCEGFELSTITYNAIARVLGRGDSIEEFWSVIEEMKNSGYEMDTDTYIKISRQFQKYDMMEDAVKLYEFMMDGPFKPSVQDCIMLLRRISAGYSPDLSLVSRVAEKYKATGNTLSKAVYDGIHRSLTSAGKFNEAEQIVEVMRNARCEPDNITYSQLVFGLCKARRLEEACKVLDDMEADGCIPDIKTWTILIQGHCAANEVEEALKCFCKMVEKNCSPDSDLLDVLANGFFKQEKIDGAYKLLVDMVKKFHIRPWQATYKLLIEKLLEASKFEEAMNLLHLMKEHNHPPFAEPFVQYISKYGSVEDAMNFLKALSVKEYPSSSAYLHVFKSFFKEGRHSDAKDLLYKSPYHIRKFPEIGKLFGPAKSGKATS